MIARVLGYDAEMSAFSAEHIERVYAGHHQRSEGAWSWATMRPTSPAIGSQHTMQECLTAPLLISSAHGQYAVRPATVHDKGVPAGGACGIEDGYGAPVEWYGAPVEWYDAIGCPIAAGAPLIPVVPKVVRPRAPRKSLSVRSVYAARRSDIDRSVYAVAMSGAMRSVPVLGSSRFFKPTEEFLAWAAAEFKGRTVYDVGAGDGFTSARLTGCASRRWTPSPTKRPCATCCAWTGRPTRTLRGLW